MNEYLQEEELEAQRQLSSQDGGIGDVPDSNTHKSSSISASYTSFRQQSMMVLERARKPSVISNSQLQSKTPSINQSVRKPSISSHKDEQPSEDHIPSEDFQEEIKEESVESEPEEVMDRRRPTIKVVTQESKKEISNLNPKTLTQQESQKQMTSTVMYIEGEHQDRDDRFLNLNLSDMNSFQELSQVLEDPNLIKQIKASIHETDSNSNFDIHDDHMSSLEDQNNTFNRLNQEALQQLSAGTDSFDKQFDDEVNRVNLKKTEEKLTTERREGTEDDEEEMLLANNELRKNLISSIIKQVRINKDDQKQQTPSKKASDKMSPTGVKSGIQTILQLKQISKTLLHSKTNINIELDLQNQQSTNRDPSSQRKLQDKNDSLEFGKEINQDGILFAEELEQDLNIKLTQELNKIHDEISQAKKLEEQEHAQEQKHIIDEVKLKISKSEKEGENEEAEEASRSSTASNLFYLITSFLFIIIFITELDLTAEQKQGQLMGSLIDGIYYDFQIKHRRGDCASALDMYNYLTVALLPQLYDERLKQVNVEINQGQDYNLFQQNDSLNLSNMTVHTLGNFNYILGVLLSFKLYKYVPNTDSLSYTVLPDRAQQRFYLDSVVDDYQEDIVSNVTGNVYQYTPGGGPRFTGAYMIYIPGDMTYDQVQATMEDLFYVGFFDEMEFMYLNFEVLTYNEAFQSGGFTSFEYYKSSDGVYYPMPYTYQSLFPLNYTMQFPSLIFIGQLLRVCLRWLSCLSM